MVDSETLNDELLGSSASQLQPANTQWLNISLEKSSQMQQTERFTRESRDQQTDRLKTMRTVANDQKK